MNIFNFIADKGTRITNNFCSKWIWVKDNDKTIKDFVRIISRHRLCEGFELVYTLNDDILFIKTIKLDKHYGSLEENIVPTLVQYLIKCDKNNPNYIQTELYMEKESGHYMVNNKKFSNRKKKKAGSRGYTETNFFDQLARYIENIDKFLFTNICTYHNLLMNCLNQRVNKIKYTFLSKSKANKKGLMAYTNSMGNIQNYKSSKMKQRICYVTYGSDAPLHSELCYFKGILNNENSNIVMSSQNELEIRLKLLVLYEDMRKYMIQSYPALSKPYDKARERSSSIFYDVNKSSKSLSDSVVEDNVDANPTEIDFIKKNPEYGFTPKEISGEEIEFNIDTLLNNSENLGVFKFDMPDLPTSLVKDIEFRDKYYKDFYTKLIKLFTDFCDYQVISLSYKVKDLTFAKLISKDNLFMIKIDTFDEFFQKSNQYVKKGKNVFIKATYYQINNVMSGLSYNELESILHDLNPEYYTTHKMTKEYFDLEEDVQIDFSEFGLDYYYEEDDEDWLVLEKSIKSIKDNFIVYIFESHKLLYSECVLNLLRNNFISIPQAPSTFKKPFFTCSFKMNITDLVVLALELKKFPFYESSHEEVKYIESEQKRERGVSDAELFLTRFNTNKIIPRPNLDKSNLSPLFTSDKIAGKIRTDVGKSGFSRNISSEYNSQNFDSKTIDQLGIKDFEIDIEKIDVLLNEILLRDFVRNGDE